MPHVINGIGTWYYGKNHLHRLRNVCSSCHNYGELASYDTTLYFVFVFVPLIPLKGVRVLDSCPSCQRHRVVPLREWNRAKADSTGEIRERLALNPADRGAIVEGLQVASYFQDEPLFNDVGEALKVRRGNDAELLDYYGDVNSYFARHSLAEEAYRDSLGVDDTPAVREKLGQSLLRQGDPDLAAGYFRHILADDSGDKSWMLYQLVVAYQSRGMHAEALATLDQVEAAFPAVLADKDWKKLRKISVKDAGRNRPVGKSAMRESATAGTRAGSRLGSLLPKLILPALLLAFAAWHTYRAVTLAGARPVYLVNGTPKPYSVLVNGTGYNLAPGVPVVAALPEGPLQIAPGEGAAAVEPTEVSYTSSFWERPYDTTTVVINPDRMAVFAKELTVYATNPPDPPPPVYQTCGTMYQYTGIDYIFVPFPDKLPLKKGDSVTKTQLSLPTVTSAEQRLRMLMACSPSEADRAEYARHWVAADPDDAVAVGWMAGTLPAGQSLTLLESRLIDRPLRVEWHRAYQTVAERAGVTRAELRGRYERLAEATRRDPGALYLLARLCDADESLKLLREAIATGRPAPDAHYALGYRLFCEGDYAPAADEMLKAGELLAQPLCRDTLHDALLAAKRYGELDQRLSALGVGGLMPRANLATMRGRADVAQASIAAMLAQLPPGSPTRQLVQSTAAVYQANAAGDIPAYLKAVKACPELESVPAKLLRGDPPDGDDLNAAEFALTLLATPAKDSPDDLEAFLGALRDGDRDETELAERLAGGSPGVADAMRQAAIVPNQKRVFAAVAARLFPAERKQLLKLASVYDFERDAVSLALKQYTKK